MGPFACRTGRVTAFNLLTFRSMHNPGCKLKTLAGLDTMLEMVYLYDNHSRIPPIDDYESARGFGEDGQHSERVGNVSDSYQL